jgi:hypothetical protein
VYYLKTLFGFWFDTEGEEFYVGNRIKEVARQMEVVVLPADHTTRCRPIFERNVYKGTSVPRLVFSRPSRRRMLELHLVLWAPGAAGYSAGAVFQPLRPLQLYLPAAVIACEELHSPERD